VGGRGLPEPGAEVRVADELGQFHPGVDLLGGGVVGQVGHGAAHQGQEAGIGVGSGEGVVDEVGDEPPSFVGRQLGEPVHELNLLWCDGSPAGDGVQHGLVQAQRADLNRQRRRVGGGDLADRDLAMEDLRDGGQVDAEVAQGGDQVQAHQRLGRVQPVAGRGAAGGRHEPLIGPEPDRPDRQPGQAGQFADRDERAVCHVRHSGASSRWKVKR
jgi:hypothetical protein